MKHAAVLCTLFLSLSLSAADPALHNVVSKVDIELHGFIKADVAYDDSETNNGNYGMYVKQETNSSTGTTAKDDDEFNLTANQSRIWLIMHGPDYQGISTGGKVEVDFYGAGAAENKATIMLRRAYLTFGWKEHGIEFLAGQHSDIFSPLYPHTINYTVAWDQGNIGYRRPQIRVTKTCEAGAVDVIAQAAISRTIGGEALTDVETDYGEDSGIPTFQGRVAFMLPWIEDTKLQTGVSGHYGKEQVETTTWRKDIDTFSVNVELKMPLTCGFLVSGEWFYGGNLDNYFGGIGQGVNLTKREMIKSEGGWAELLYKGVKDWNFAVGAGLDNPHNKDLDTGDRKRNELFYANVTHNLTPNLAVGAAYNRLHTYYKRGHGGRDNRIQFTAIYKF